MFIFGIITSIFWALLVAVVLWVLCAFSGKLVNTGFRMSALQHVLCLVVAVPTVILLVIVFTCNKLNRLVSKADDGIAKVMMADGRFVERLTRQIASKPDTEALTDFLAGEFAESVSSEYPMLGKYIDVNKLANNLNIDKQLQDISKGVDASKAALQIVKTSTGKFTEGVSKKIKSARRKALIALLLLQALCFGAALYKAGTYRNVSSVKFYQSNDYL